MIDKFLNCILLKQKYLIPFIDQIYFYFSYLLIISKTGKSHIFLETFFLDSFREVSLFIN